MKHVLAVLLFILVCAPAFANTVSEKGKISYLLEAISTSGVTFVRNDTKYSGVEAKDHLELKLRNAGSRIQTADDFITYLASKSSISGKPYLILLPDGSTITCGKWLRDKLAAMPEK